MHKILVLGAGKIGVPIACFLADSRDYSVILADAKPFLEEGLHSEIQFVSLDISHKDELLSLIQANKVQSVVSCLPYFHTFAVAQLCREHHIHYFDLTEDREISKQIQTLAHNAQSAFVPHCGLAPGFISIATYDRMQKFEHIDTVLMRVGALPQYPHNKLKYALNWSVDGLINEYSHAGSGLVNGEEEYHQPLEGLETIEIDGLLYEAFNTSGGLGSLGRSSVKKVKLMNYKTIRYPGHCELMHFLMIDLKLKDQPAILKTILAGALCSTNQDVVIIYIAIKGDMNQSKTEDIWVKKIYPQMQAGQLWSAIQITTASAACAVIDTVLAKPSEYQGFILQEQFKLNDILNNRFAACYRD